MLALDLSFSAPRVTPAWCAARLEEGYKLAIAGLWTGRYAIDGAEHALRTWREAGGIPAAYLCIHDAAPLALHIGRARAAAGEEWARLAFVAIDVEVEPVSARTVRQACELVEADGLRPIIYTRRNFWRDHVGNDQTCARWPLWDASYGIPPALDVPGYGGWTLRTGHQYHDTQRVDGIDVDLNVFEQAWVREGLGPTREKEIQNLLDVTNGISAQLAEYSKQLADVRDIAARLLRA